MAWPHGLFDWGLTLWLGGTLLCKIISDCTTRPSARPPAQR